MFCKNCGKEINDEAVVCVNCGCAVGKLQGTSEKSFVAALLLCLFFGIFGAHRFYVGRAGSGAAMLIITLMLGWVFGIGLLITGIWGFIDLILILCGVFKDANEQKLK